MPGAGGKRKNRNADDDLDPCDPSFYSDAPRGKWGQGLEQVQAQTCATYRCCTHTHAQTEQTCAHTHMSACFDIYLYIYIYRCTDVDNWVYIYVIG